MLDPLRLGHSWRRHKLAVCLACRATLRNPKASAHARQIARAQLRLTQENFARLLWARHLARFLRPVDSGETVERRPFTVADHARIFDAIHEGRASAELWRAKLAKLRQA